MERITIRQLIIEEMTKPSRDFADRLENRLHNYILAFTNLHKRLALDNQEFHTAREIQKLEDRLILSSTVQEESA